MSRGMHEDRTTCEIVVNHEEQYGRASRIFRTVGEQPVGTQIKKFV
jgi:hypothetical protein